MGLVGMIVSIDNSTITKDTFSKPVNISYTMGLG